MCLSVLHEEHNPPIHRSKPITAWKVFVKHEGELQAEFRQDNYDTDFVPKNKWLQSTNSRIYCSKKADCRVCPSDYSLYEFSYKSGFHCFKSRAQARRYKGWGSAYVVRKVLIKDVVAYGRQCEANVLVAKKMKVIG